MSTRVTVATLNTRGFHLPGTRLSERYAAIGAGLDADLVCLQEVMTYRHLGLIRRGAKSYPSVLYGRGVGGPAGGLVVLSRGPVRGATFTWFERLSYRAQVPLLARMASMYSGALTVRLDGLRVFNTHLTANTDGDWSAGNRFELLQRTQFASLAGLVRAGSSPAVVCGDFNAPRHSVAYGELLTRSGLLDAFDGECPPTFHAEYLGPGHAAHCIDFVLVPAEATVEHTGLLFADRVQLPRGPGHVSDHLGLTARIVLPS